MRVFWVGLVKGNVGYLFVVVGVIGVIKVIELFCVCLILFLFYVVLFLLKVLFGCVGIEVFDCVVLWVVDGLLCVGVNVFGFGGMNVYVVFEEFWECVVLW